LEIWILICIAMYLIQRFSMTYYIEKLQDDPKSNQNPLLSAFGNSETPSSTSDVAPTNTPSNTQSSSWFRNVVAEKTRKLFGGVISMFQPIFKIFEKIFQSFVGGINRIRNILMPVRMFFIQASKMFFDQFQHFTIGILYSFHKMRNAMKRTVSGFNLIFHSMEHTKNTLDSIVESPLLDTVATVISPARWVNSQNNQYCFHKHTRIQTIRGHTSISELAIGDILEDGSRVISVQCFRNYRGLYKYKNKVFVSGNHLVWDTLLDQWVPVCRSRSSQPTSICPEFVYNISTTNAMIPIEDCIFKDYSESNLPAVNQMINQCVLNELNQGTASLGSSSTTSAPTFLLHGFGPETPVHLENGHTVLLSHLRMGDIVEGNYPVVGVVKIDARYVSVYRIRSPSNQELLVSSNTKLWWNGRWVAIEDIATEPNVSRLDTYSIPEYLYNIVLQGTHEWTLCGFRVCDFAEVDSASVVGQHIQQLASMPIIT
jgi:hypothetical protein